MRSDYIRIFSNGENMDAALNEVEKVAVYKGLSGKTFFTCVCWEKR